MFADCASAEVREEHCLNVHGEFEQWKDMGKRTNQLVIPSLRQKDWSKFLSNDVASMAS